MSDPSSYSYETASKPSTSYKPPDHLSEFYSFVNPSQASYRAESITSSRKHERHHSIIRKPSLTTVNTFSSFSPSVLDLPTLVTSGDVRDTVTCFQNVVKAASNYREALLHVSNAASEFGQALEECARCKGTGSAADGLMSAGGLHYLVANHQQILSESISKSFEQPVQQEIETFEKNQVANEKAFKTEIKNKSIALKRNELENLKLSKLKTRNLQKYKNNLLTLTNQIDEIDKLKHDYYLSTFEIVQNASMKILKRTGSVVRAQVEIYEGIARKGWSGGGLDDLIAQCPDPFNDDEDDENENDRGDDEGLLKNNYMSNPLIYSNGITNASPVSHVGSYNSILNLHSGQPIQEEDESNGTITHDGTIRASTPTQLSNNDSTGKFDDSADESFSLPVTNHIIRRDGTEEEEEEEEDVGHEDKDILNDINSEETVQGVSNLSLN